MNPAMNPANHLGLVYQEAHRVARSHRDDARAFLADGYLGLAHACERFDPSRGLSLSTFAVPRIRGAMRDTLRREARQRHADLSRTLADTRPLPLDAIAQDGLRAEVRAAIEAPGLLTPRERAVVIWRYWHDKSGVEIARRLARCEAVVSRTLASAHGKLQARLGARG